MRDHEVLSFCILAAAAVGWKDVEANVWMSQRDRLITLRVDGTGPNHDRVRIVTLRFDFLDVQFAAPGFDREVQSRILRALDPSGIHAAALAEVMQ